MIRSKRVNAYSDNAVLNEYYGLSTDTKPTENVATGSIFIEVDTGATFLYDEEGEDWSEVQSGSSGGGGGGDSDFSIAVVTIINHTGYTLTEQKIPTCFEAGELGEGAPAVCAPYNPAGYPVGETSIKVPLYKGRAVFFPTTAPDSMDGDIDESGLAIIITGNGSITWEDAQ